MNLTDYRWENRLILLFAPSAGDEAYRQQIAELTEERASLRERDLLVFHLLENGESFTGETPIPATKTNRWREKFGVETGSSTIILLGKDGGEKRRRPMPDSLDEINALIDTMPMRRAEMRRDDEQ